MNGKLFGLTALAVAGVTVLALACGGDGQEDSAQEDSIRVDSGLAVSGAAQPTPAFGGEIAFARGGGPFGPTPIAQPAPAFGGEIAFARGGGPAFGPQPFPFSQEGQGGINVQGFGSATTPATTARLQLFVVGGEGYYAKPVPYPECPPGERCPEPAFPEPQPLTEADLAPIVEAIKAQGIAEGDIAVSMNPGGYYDPYGPGRASITVTISDPQERVQPIIEAAREAATASENLFLESTNVLYSVSPELCATLEEESMLAAVEDARDRAQLLAQLLGVGIGDVVFASHYSYSPFGFSPCDPTALAYPEYYGGYYGLSQPAEVTLIANVSVTYAIQ